MTPCPCLCSCSAGKARLRLFLGLYLLASTVGLIWGGSWALIGIIGALLMAALARVESGRWPLPTRMAVLFACGLLGAMTLSIASALDPAIAKASTLKMATILLPLMLFSSPAFYREGAEEAFKPWLIAVGLAFSLLVMDVLIVSDMIKEQKTITDFIAKRNRGFSYNALLMWPLMACLVSVPALPQRRFRWVMGALAAVFVVGLAVTNSRATQTGFLMACGLFFVSLFFFRAAFSVVCAGSFAALFWPLGAALLFAKAPAVVEKLPASWHMRVEIWDYTAHRIAERPFQGYGLGNSKLLDVMQPNGASYLFVKEAAAHSHNAVCQAWSELGVLGPFFIAFLAAWTLRGLYRLEPRLRPYALAAYVVAFWLSMVAYNFWTDSLWAAFALTAASFALLQAREIKASLRGKDA